MYLCFLGWWEIFPHLPPRLLSPLLCWPAFCWEEGIVVGVIQEEQGEGGGVGTIKHWWDASEDREEKGKQRPKEEEEEQSLMPSCSSLWSQNGSCSLLNFPWIYPGHTQCAHTHTHTHTPDPLTSSNLLYSQKSSLSVPVPFHAQILGVLFLWASPELGTDSSPAPKPLSMAVESPKHRTHPVREEMQATWGIGSLWRMISCPRPFWVVIFEDVKLMQKKLWDPCCRPLLHTANYAGLFAVLSGSVMSNYAMKS